MSCGIIWVVPGSGGTGIGSMVRRALEVAGSRATIRRLLPPVLVSHLTALDPAELRDTLVVVDVDPADKHAFFAEPLGSASELVVSFPEVSWIFCGAGSAPECDLELKRRWLLSAYVQRWAIEPLARLLHEHQAGLSSMFDRHGLRAGLRRRVWEARIRRQSPLPPAYGTQRAVTVDEEPAFSYFTAYTAYRRGYAASPVTTLRGFAIEGRPEGQPTGGDEVALTCTIEDLQLAFPDDSGPARAAIWPDVPDSAVEVALGLSSSSPDQTLADRELLVPLLRSDCQIVLTSDPRLEGSPEGRRIAVSKPFPGIHWLTERLPRLERKADPAPAAAEPGRHASHGAYQVPVQRLLERSRALRQRWSEAAAPLDCLHGALLALEARRLLGRMSLATSIEALDLQHTQEAGAECVFHGVSNPVEVESRLDELRREIRALLAPNDDRLDCEGWWAPRAAMVRPPFLPHGSLLERARDAWRSRLRPSTRKQYWSAYSRIVRNLRAVFAACGQIEEESRCLHQLRKAVRNERFWGQVLARTGGRWYGLRSITICLGLLQRAGSWYFALGVRSVRWALVLLAFWIAFFAVVFSRLHGIDAGGDLTLLEAVQSALLTLLTIEPHFVCGCDPAAISLLLPFAILDMVLGYVHLGLLVSLVYQWMSRR